MHDLKDTRPGLAALSFPLNVYAQLLLRQEGRVEHLHYGVFARPDEPVTAAQERAHDLLRHALPPPPARVLDVGAGLGTTLQQLREAGYEAAGITPDPAQVAWIRQRHGAATPVGCSRLEDLEPPARPYDILLFQESAQYVAPLDILAAADRLLHDDACLVVMDEFAFQRRGPDDAGLHLLAHFEALAARHGWRQELRLDLSAEVRPTLQYLATGLERLGPELAEASGVPVAEMAALQASARRYLQLHEGGVYGYALLRWRRSSRPRGGRWIRVGGGEQPAMSALFQSTFGRPMDAAEWNWKYGQGRGSGIGLLRDGQLLAHAGAVSRRVVDAGQDVLACQVGDVMVSPAARAALGRGGTMHELMATLLEEQIGWGRPHLHGFGFPNDRAFEAAAARGLYARVDGFTCCAWPAAPAPAGLGLRALNAEDLDAGSAPALQVDAWARSQARALAPEGCIVPLRDAAWLRHRYLRHPLHRYEVQIVEDAERGAQGVAVWRAGEGKLVLLDLVAAPADLGALIAAARERALALGFSVVETWITTSQLHRLQAAAPEGFASAPMPIALPANAHTPGPDPRSQQGRWFLLAGDADFT